MSTDMLRIWASFKRIWYADSLFQQWFRQASLADIIESEQLCRATREAYER